MQQQYPSDRKQSQRKGQDSLLSPTDERIPQNIMFDRRVCRGSNYLHHTAATSPPSKPQQHKPHRHTVEGDQERSRSDNQTPDPVQGRQHIEAQTMTYLEVLEQKSPEKESSQQTDPLLDLPNSPRFVPQPSGDHKSTQIEPGDLFDFDFEVEPLLEVLAGKTFDLAVMEVIEEIEQADLASRRDQFEQMRNVELAETQRIEARETRLFEEKQRRKQQEKDRLRLQAELATKVAARTVSKATLEDLQQRIIGHLEAKGHFRDPVMTQVSNDFLPWMVQQTSNKLGAIVNVNTIVNTAVLEAVNGALQTDAAITGARQALLKQKHDESVAVEKEKAAAAAAMAAAAMAEPITESSAEANLLPPESDAASE